MDERLPCEAQSRDNCSFACVRAAQRASVLHVLAASEPAMTSTIKFLVLVWFLSCFLHFADAFKPIFALHGIGSGHNDWKHMSQWISTHHPGTNFVALPVYQDVESYVSLREQVNGIIRFISNITDAQPQVYGQGYHLVCHSQGALLCRCIAQEWDDHQISALVSLAGPQVQQSQPRTFKRVTQSKTGWRV
jgi:pimeloyl-ACP methyl ester carboxylesterase